MRSIKWSGMLKCLNESINKTCDKISGEAFRVNYTKLARSASANNKEQERVTC